MALVRPIGLSGTQILIIQVPYFLRNYAITDREYPIDPLEKVAAIPLLEFALLDRPYGNSCWIGVAGSRVLHSLSDGRHLVAKPGFIILTGTRTSLKLSEAIDFIASFSHSEAISVPGTSST